MPEEITVNVPTEVTVPPTKVTWGFRSLLHPTPEFASTVFNFILSVCSVVTLILYCFPQIPSNIKTTVNELALAIIAFTRLFTKMFGIKIKDVDSDTAK